VVSGQQSAVSSRQKVERLAADRWLPAAQLQIISKPR
jgi:hypothetical protein